MPFGLRGKAYPCKGYTLGFNTPVVHSYDTHKLFLGRGFIPFCRHLPDRVSGDHTTLFRHKEAFKIHPPITGYSNNNGGQFRRNPAETVSCTLSSALYLARPGLGTDDITPSWSDDLQKVKIMLIRDCKVKSPPIPVIRKQKCYKQNSGRCRLKVDERGA